MIKVAALLFLVAVGTMSKFSPELVAKYSIEILKEGKEGTEPTKGDSVKMHYTGTLKDGTKFDSSYDRGDPLPVRIGNGQVITCWDEVGLHMNIGEKVKVLCPSATAYGSRAIGPIPASSDLIFIIERVN
jgi:FKBP-type peptidyl-prolyl cis-trans isomerase